MRKSVMLLIAAVTLISALPTYAELQNVVVGGQLRIRGNWFDYGDNWNTYAAVEQRTRLSVRADFTDNVSAFIELDSYDTWGDNFRSNYLTGVDGRGAADISLYQGYIQAKEMWGTALQARIGRQEIKLGSGWLVGTNDSSPFFTGLSFDAVRLTYATDQFSVDAIWAILADVSPVFEDANIDMYALYGSYLGIENVTLDAYWIYIRNALLANDLDTHTFGLRGAGTVGALDFEAELAYQLLDADGLDSDAFAANLVVGYTFDVNYSPRVFVDGAYFESSDDDFAFNRLFSDWRYSKVLDKGIYGVGNGLTNFWTAGLGVSVMPTESVKVELTAGYFSNVEDYGFDDSNLGWEVSLGALYKYSDDLAFKAGYTHFFNTADNDVLLLEQGQGLAPLLLQVDDVDYFYLETQICF